MRLNKADSMKHLALLVIALGTLFGGCGPSAADRQKADETAAAMNTFRALMKIEAATEVGVNYQNYGGLLIDARAAVNEAQLLLPDSDLKKIFENTIVAYKNALDVWKEKIDGSASLDAADVKVKGLIQKYSLPVTKSEYAKNFSYVNPDLAMQLIWAEATKLLVSVWPLLQERLHPK